MKEHWLKAKEWWAGLSLREKQAVAGGGVFLAIFIVYQWIWSPLVSQAAMMRKRIVTQQKSLLWMQAADKELQKAQGQSQTRNKSASPVVLLSVIQKQINHAGLESSLSQLKQASNESIEVHFQKVEFDKLVAMLTFLIKAQSISIAQMSVMAEGTPGIVNADVVLRIE